MECNGKFHGFNNKTQSTFGLHLTPLVYVARPLGMHVALL